MMAFFLVMWLVSQDRKVKQAVSRYFSDPVGFMATGSSTSPSKAGAMFDSQTHGDVPGSDGRLIGRGRGSHADRGQGVAETRAVSEWLLGDESQAEYWKEQVAERRLEARASAAAQPEQTTDIDEVVRGQLAQQIRDELIAQMPEDLPPHYQELLFSAMGQVDFEGLAEECLSQ
jgi:flagellar motor protein MotB